MTRAVPQNSNFEDTGSSMEFHGTSIFDDTNSPMEFHRIPWNLGCANFDDTSSSMEFHGTWDASISMTRAVQWFPWNSMEFHITWVAPISMTRAVPWNSMELRVRQFR